MNLPTLKGSEWVKALRALADANGEPESQEKLRLGLSYLGENFAELEAAGRECQLPAPVWEARTLRRTLVQVSDLGDDVSFEGIRSKDDGLKKLGRRLRIAASTVRDGLVEANVPQVEARLLTVAESQAMTGALHEANELFERAQRPGATEAEKEAARLAEQAFMGALLPAAEVTK